MSKRRHGIEALGLSLLAALGLMAFAASAQAGEYTLEGGSFTSKGLAQETVEGTVGAGKLLVPGFGITFACTGGTGSGTVLLGGVAHATVLFTGCTVEGNKFCKVFETKAKMEANLDPGFIAASGLGELVLMQTFGPVQHFLLLSSAEFATLYLTRSTSGCTLPLENKVSGSTVFFTGGGVKFFGQPQPVHVVPARTRSLIQRRQTALWKPAFVAGRRFGDSSVERRQ